MASREKPKQVVVAPEGDSAFGLPATAWAAQSGDPILYTAKDRLPHATVAAMKEFPAMAYVLGPPSAISPTVVDELRKVATGVKRRYLDGIKPLGRVWIVGDEESIAASQRTEIERLVDANER